MEYLCALEEIVLPREDGVALITSGNKFSLHIVDTSPENSVLTDHFSEYRGLSKTTNGFGGNFLHIHQFDTACSPSGSIYLNEDMYGHTWGVRHVTL